MLFSHTSISLIILVFQFSFTNANVLTIYQDEKYKVKDFPSLNGQYIRLFSTNKVVDEYFGHGFIAFDNIDRVLAAYIKLLMGSLFLQPQTKRVLLIGLGVGVLTRSLYTSLSSHGDRLGFQIDIVELDAKVLEIAQKYFFFEPKTNTHVHIGDGYEFVLNLNESSIYDLILVDAMTDLYEDICAPESFLNERFMLKLKAHLAKPNGVFGVNTLPPYCRRHKRERNLYERVFGELYESTIDVNRVFLAVNGPRRPSEREVNERAQYYRRSFNLMGMNEKWISEKVNHVSRPLLVYQNEMKTSFFDYVFSSICLDG